MCVLFACSVLLVSLVRFSVAGMPGSFVYYLVCVGSLCMCVTLGMLCMLHILVIAGIVGMLCMC